MSRLSLGTKLASAFALTLILMLVAAAVAVTKMGALADRTADAKQGAILDEQIMSMEIAAREALDVEATAILYGAPTALDGRLDAAWKSNEGDAFAESLAEAERLAVLDMPSRLKQSEAAAQGAARPRWRAPSRSSARATSRRARANRAALDDARVRRLRRGATTTSRRSRRSSARPRPTGAASIATGGKRTVIIVALVALLLAAACAGVITRGITPRRGRDPRPPRPRCATATPPTSPAASPPSPAAT